MPRITVSRVVEAPAHRVWAAIADLGSHVDWMRDASSIRFITTQTKGVGTRLEVETRLGPLHTVDVMEVTAWEEGRSIDVSHQGLVKGRGVLAAGARGDDTVVTWTEDLAFPWWLGGALTAWLARPVLAAIWRGNLKRLAASVTSPGNPPHASPETR